jgi:hypothetical protein
MLDRSPLLLDALTTGFVTHGAGVGSPGRLGYYTQNTGRAFYGRKALKGIEQGRKKREKCLKRAGTDGKKQFKCDEQPTMIGGVNLLRRTPLRVP